MAYQRDASQVITWAPDGSDPRYFGRIGHVVGLDYSFACPGGPDQLSLTLQTQPGKRDQALNPGRKVGVYRGASEIWNGKLDEPTSGTAGWAVTAHGAGTFGTDYRAMYGTGSGYSSAPSSSSTETETQVLAFAAAEGWTADGPINQAIARNIPGRSWGGLPWVNPGIAHTVAAGYQAYAPGGKTLTQLGAAEGVTLAQFRVINPRVVAKFGASKVLPHGTGYWVPRHAGASIAYLGSQSDPASVTVTDFLNAITAPMNLLWYVGRGNVLRVFSPPTVPTRRLICTSPAARTLHGYYTTLWAYYQATVDATTDTGLTSTDIPATFNAIAEQNVANSLVHGTMENFIDLTSAGVIDTAVAQKVLVALLAKYQAVSYSEAFPVMQGQLTTMGGTPVDLGCEQAGTCVQLILADGGYGGEVLPLPVTFVIGAYDFSDDTQSATVTPWQSAIFDLPTMMGQLASLMTR